MQRSLLISLVAALLVSTAMPVRASSGGMQEGVTGMPQFSLVLDAQYAGDNQQGKGGEIIEEAAGILHGVHVHEDAHQQEHGLGLGNSEVAVEAELPSQLKARVSIALGVDTLELEDAWVQTQSLPAGLAVKMGRFLSGMGHLNNQHLHERDFANGNLMYDALLGVHGLLDNGVQLTWQLPVPFYMQWGVEALQGSEQERFGALIHAEDADAIVQSGAGLAEQKAGPRNSVVFAKVAPYLAEQHSLQLGVSWAQARQFQQVLDEDVTVVDDQYAAQGRQTLWGLDALYQYDGEGRAGAGDLEAVAEYMWLEKNMCVTGADAGAGVAVGERVSGHQDGAYVQVIYGVAPQWQAGFRHEVVGMRNELMEGLNRHAMESSQRTSAVLSYRPNASTRWRLQLSSAAIRDEHGDKTRLEQISLGYTVTLGSHAGHAH